MRSEEILRREAEYRAVREALGTYDVALVLAGTCPQGLPEVCMPAVSPVLVGSPSSSTPLDGVPGVCETQAPMDG